MWERVSVTFKLKSPLHIGYIPFKGSVVSPTRYYVLGRNLWGAITKKITEELYQEPIGDNYRLIGTHVAEAFRFSYFYVYDGETVYLPEFTEEGLKYGDDKKKITVSAFEKKFVGSRISTAIDEISYTAKQESLHEIEFINDSFKDESGCLRRVKIAGCIWCKKGAVIDGKEIVYSNEGIFIDDFNIIEELILGGESKYGFGHVMMDTVNKVKVFEKVNQIHEDSNDGKLKVTIKEGSSLLAHFEYSKNLNFRGDIELLSGRGYFYPDAKERSDRPGKVISKPEYYFSPGTVFVDRCNVTAEVCWDGTMRAV